MFDFARFETLTFDCYGTLINWEEGILGSLHGILAAHGKGADDSTLLQLYGEFEAQAEMGEYCSYREVLGNVVKQFAKQFDFVPSSVEVNALAESLGAWRPWPDTVNALRELRRHFRWP